MIVETSIVVSEPTTNGHLFAREVLEKAIDAFNEKPLKPIGMTYRGGFLADANVVLDLASHSINCAFINQEGRLCFDITIMETPKGILLSTMVDQCAPNTVSIGTVNSEAEVTDLEICRLDMIDESDTGEHDEGDIS